jgi:uncharacterized membrane protein YbhN (UPF0104 family)
LQIVKKLITIAVIAVVFFFLIRGLVLNWSKIPLGDLHFNISLVIISFVALAIYFMIYGRSWQVIMRDLNAPILFSQSIWMIATTQVGKYLPGKVWYIVGRIYVGKQAEIDGKKLTLSMVLETCLVYVTGGIVFSLTTFIAGNYSLTWLIISTMLTIAAIIVIHPRILVRISNFFLRILKKPTVRLTLTYRQISRISLYFFGIWIAQIAGFYFLIKAIYPIPVRSIFNLASAYSLAWISGSLAVFAPGGLGVREGMMALLLSSILPIPLPIAISFISRVWITIFEAVVFFVGLIIQRRTAAKANP